MSKRITNWNHNRLLYQKFEGIIYGHSEEKKENKKKKKKKKKQKKKKKRKKKRQYNRM